jgi:hypothetical protein
MPLSVFKYVCLELNRRRYSDGQLCTSYLWDAQPSNAGCDEYILKVAQRQVKSPFGGGEGAREDFASLTSECAAGGYPTTTATSLVISR